MHSTSPLRNDPSDAQYGGRARLPGSAAPCPCAEGRPTQELLTLYVVERWLARLAVSPYAEQFVLKGGILLAAFDARRPTADIDTLAQNFANDEATVVARIVAIAEQSLPDDGVEYRIHTEHRA